MTRSDQPPTLHIPLPTAGGAGAAAKRPADGALPLVNGRAAHESGVSPSIQQPPLAATQQQGGVSPFAQTTAQQGTVAARASGSAPDSPPHLEGTGSMEDVWREIMATHHSTLDFSTYTPHGEQSSDEEGEYSSDGSGGGGDDADVLIGQDELLPGAGSSSGGDQLASGVDMRRRDTAKRRVRKVGHEMKGAAREVKQQALRLTRSFTEYRTIAGESFVDARRLTKVANLGEGAFANVEWAVLRRPGGEDVNVAVKRLRADLISSDQDLSDFVREGALLKRLHNPNIVEFVGLGFRTDQGPGDSVSGDSMFIVQEFMNGGTLKLMVLEQMVAHHKVVFTFGDALRWMTQIAEGLAYLHACRPLIIHRDLKLENCLLTENEDGVMNVKLADFGLHAMVDATDRNETVRKIKRMASSVVDSETAARAISNLEPSQRLDSVLTISGPSAARLSPAARDAALSRSASAGLDEQLRAPRPRVIKRSMSAAAHSGGMQYRPSRLGRPSKERPAAATAAAGASAVAPEPASDRTRSSSSTRAGPSRAGSGTSARAGPSRAGSSGSGNGGSGGKGDPGRKGSSSSGRGAASRSGSNSSSRGAAGRTGSGSSSGRRRGSSGSTDSETAEARLLRAAGERGSRIWQRVAGRVHLHGQPDPQAKHELTGQTGSFMYMAPEVMNSKSYNEKVDVFSLGIIIFEVFAKSVTGAALLQRGDIDECEMYAWKVAHGYRRPIPTWWPPQLAALVINCWADCPDDRPTAAEVVKQLKSLRLSGVISKMDKGSSAGCCCCCCIQ